MQTVIILARLVAPNSPLPAMPATPKNAADRTEQVRGLARRFCVARKVWLAAMGLGAGTGRCDDADPTCLRALPKDSERVVIWHDSMHEISAPHWSSRTLYRVYAEWSHGIQPSRPVLKLW